jgi:hypothetical protein
MGVSSDRMTFDKMTRLVISLTSGESNPATTAIQSHIVERDRSTPWRRNIPSWR